ncbi:hypothetical protein V497_06837 [Pseudogymnoascus sp. VKM F-4516 (FW-969)]|nr:hypothetical protein V497_06837 [Pseudogymnoascus sp. VKM F-4516 (FW-969)]
MAPMRPRPSLSKERFPAVFSNLKTQTYHDPSARGVGSHAIRCLDWNPLGTLIASGSADRTLRVWNPDRPVVRYSTELKGHDSSIEKVAFNPVKDAELASLSADGVLKLWDVRTKTCTSEVKGLGSAVSLAWHPDGDGIIVGNKTDNLFLIDPVQAKVVAEYAQDVQTNEIAFCWSGKRIFVSTGEGRVKILSYPDLQPVFQCGWEDKPLTLNGHTSSCLSLALQPTARYLASGGSDSIISLWDTRDWLCQRTLIDMTGPVRNISFSWDGMYVVGGSDEGNGLEIAHVETGEYVHSIKSQAPSPVVAWHPTKYQLAYTDFGGLKIIGIDSDRKHGS